MSGQDTLITYVTFDFTPLFVLFSLQLVHMAGDVDAYSIVNHTAHHTVHPHYIILILDVSISISKRVSISHFTNDKSNNCFAANVTFIFELFTHSGIMTAEIKKWVDLMHCEHS